MSSARVTNKELPHRRKIKNDISEPGISRTKNSGSLKYSKIAIKRPQQNRKQRPARNLIPPAPTHLLCQQFPGRPIPRRNTVRARCIPYPKCWTQRYGEHAWPAQPAKGSPPLARSPAGAGTQWQREAAGVLQASDSACACVAGPWSGYCLVTPLGEGWGCPAIPPPTSENFSSGGGGNEIY